MVTKNFKSKEPGIPYFVTFTVVEWLNVFTKFEYCQILWESLQYCRKEKKMQLHAFVFMSNHIHLVISAKNEKPFLWEIIRDFKKFTAQKIIQKMQKDENRKWILEIMERNGRRNKSNVQYQFWIQDDGAIEISSEKFLHQKIDYIHNNPIRAGIVLEAGQYVWSSDRLYEADDFRFIDAVEV